MVNKVIKISLTWLFIVNLFISAQALETACTEISNHVICHLILPRTARYKTFTLTNPNRVVIDIEHVPKNFKLTRQLHCFEPVTKMHGGYFKPGIYRIVLETKAPVQVKRVLFKHQQRLEISLSQPVVPVVAYIEATNANDPIAILSANNFAKKPLEVVIDPGHGGRDPGALGLDGSSEKVVVLQIAQRLQQILSRQANVHVTLTRSNDEYLSLRQRLKIARQANADLFISIHADACENKQAAGPSVFSLSARGATSEAARWLALKENYSELDGIDLSDKNSDLRSVLIDLSQSATLPASQQLARSVLSELSATTKLHANQVEQARFVVLKSPDIPSVLIETGYISNQQEEKKLTDAHYQQLLAESLAKAVQNYRLVV